MLRFRLQTARAVYKRPASWRWTLTITPAAPSDSYASSVREIRNIRRRWKKLRLARMRLGQRRSMSRLLPFGKATKSDAFLSPGTKDFRRTWRYWRAR